MLYTNNNEQKLLLEWMANAGVIYNTPIKLLNNYSTQYISHIHCAVHTFKNSSIYYKPGAVSKV